MAIETIEIDESTTPGAPGAPGIAVDNVGGANYEIGKVAFGAAGAATLVDETHGLPVATGLAQPLTDADLRATPVAVVADLAEALKRWMALAANPLWADPSVGALRTVFPSAQAVTVSSGTITTVTTASNLAAIGGVNAATLVLDMMSAVWAQAVRPRVA